MSSNSLILASQKTYPASLVLNFDETPFVDSSSYNNTVTNVNSSVETSSNAKFGNYAAWWNGSGSGGGLDGVEISVGNEFNFGTGDFTIECWFNIDLLWDDRILFTMGHPVDKYGIQLKLSEGIVTSAGCTLEYSIGDGTGVSGSWAFQMNPLDNVTYDTWHHVAVTRNNGIASLYLDGILIGSAYNSTNITNYNSKFRVGPFVYIADLKIDGVRVVKGAALYTGTAYIIPNIPPSKYAVISPKLDNHIVITSAKSSGDISGYVTTSTGYYTVHWWDGTKTIYTSGDIFAKAAVGGSKNITIYPSAGINSLLLNFNGANNSTVFTNSSPNNYITGTVYGNAKISTTQSKFGGSSGYFDGTGDYVQFPYNSIFDLSSGDWTLESWFYAISLAADMTTASNAIISKDTNGANFNWNINVAQNGIVFITNNLANAGTDVLYAYTTISTNTWHHVAIVKYGSYVKIYLNGVLVDSKSMTVNNTTTNAITIGCNSHNNPSGFFNGYIDDLRVVKGKALYTSNFTPPISELTSDIGSDVIGNFLAIDVSNNSLTSVRPFHSRFITGPGTAGYYNYYYYWYNYPYTGWMRNVWVPAVSGTVYQLDITSNNLDSSALDQLYLDLLKGNGSVNVSDNTGGDSDNPTIATAKGYTVYGSVAPILELLLNLNGSNGSTTFTDSSSNSRSITLQTGSPSLNTTTKKYGSAALSVNSGSIGNNSYIIPDLSNVDYTIEFWIYRPTATANYEGVINLSNGASTVGVNIHLYTSNEIQFNDGQAGAAAGGTLGATQWYHVACVSDNNVKKLFIDGILVSSSAQVTPAGPYKILIGKTYTFNQTSNAYIDDVRIIKGKALYDNDFVPPSSELTTSTTVTLGTTVLLLKGNGTNNGTTFTDDGHKALTATRNGNTITSTAQYKYGTASIYFDGTGDYLSYSTGKDNFNFLNSNFTIECWIRPSNVTGERVIFSKRANTGTYGGFIFQCNGNKLNILATNNGSSWGINLDSTSTLSTNTWYHVAVTRLYDTFKIFIDGNLEGSQTIEDFIISPNTANVVIGAGGATGGQEFFGYIDDLRIVRGASLYNNDFTVPPAELGLYP